MTFRGKTTYMESSVYVDITSRSSQDFFKLAILSGILPAISPWGNEPIDALGKVDSTNSVSSGPSNFDNQEQERVTQTTDDSTISTSTFPVPTNAEPTFQTSVPTSMPNPNYSESAGPLPPSDPNPSYSEQEYSMYRYLGLKRPYLSGKDVFVLQVALNSESSSNLTVDGVLGPNTESAIRSYQQDNQLSVDGVAGNQTYRQLDLRSSL